MNMNAENDQSAARVARPSPLAMLHTIKLPLWVGLVLLALLAGVFIWKQIEVGGAERRLAAERQVLIEKTEADKAALQHSAQETLASQSAEIYQLFGTALAWNVRSAMMRKNYDEIDQYFSALVKHDRIQLALLADPAGKVLVASDRKYLESRFSDHFPAALLQQPGVTIHPGEGKERRLVLPIQGLNSQLGTVVLTYTAP